MTSPNIPKVGKCHDKWELLNAIAEICHTYNVTGLAVVVSVKDGECITTHQFGMEDNELIIGGLLLNDYAQGITINHMEQ